MTTETVEVEYFQKFKNFRKHNLIIDKQGHRYTFNRSRVRTTHYKCIKYSTAFKCTVSLKVDNTASKNKAIISGEHNHEPEKSKTDVKCVTKKSKVKEPPKTIRCTVCQKVHRFKSRARLCEDKHNKKFKLKCDVCGHGTNYPSHMERHKQTHTQVKKYQCGVGTCNYSSGLETNISRHRRKKHPQIAPQPQIKISKEDTIKIETKCENLSPTLQTSVDMDKVIECTLFMDFEDRTSMEEGEVEESAFDESWKESPTFVGTSEDSRTLKKENIGTEKVWEPSAGTEIFINEDGSVLESYTVGVSNQVDEEDPDDDDDPLQDDGAVDKLKYEDIPLNTSSLWSSILERSLVKYGVK